MTTTFPSSDLIAGLRRSFAVCGLAALAVLAGCGGDDDDDDGGTGPSVDCIDQVDFSATIFDADDAEALAFGDTESGSLSNSDVENNEGLFFDVWVVAIESDREVTLRVDPAEFDAVMAVFDDEFGEIVEVDAGFEGEAEEVTDDTPEGCYVIVVTSFEAGETGSYTIRVD